MNVFTYGSLMYESVWCRVVTRRYVQKIGTVQGFRRLKVNNEVYPGLIKGEGEVQGVVYFDVTAEDLTRLDQFEGALYHRKEIDVRCADGTRARAWGYIVRDKYKGLLGDVWSPEEFERVGLARFETGYAGFGRV